MQFICFSKGKRLVPCWFPVACGLKCLEIFGCFTGLVKRGSMALFYGRVIASLFRPSSQPPLIDLLRIGKPKHLPPMSLSAQLGKLIVCKRGCPMYYPPHIPSLKSSSEDLTSRKVSMSSEALNVD